MCVTFILQCCPSSSAMKTRWPSSIWPRHEINKSRSYDLEMRNKLNVSRIEEGRERGWTERGERTITEILRYQIVDQRSPSDNRAKMNFYIQTATLSKTKGLHVWKRVSRLKIMMYWYSGAQLRGEGRWGRLPPPTFHNLSKDMALNGCATHFILGLRPCFISSFVL